MEYQLLRWPGDRQYLVAIKFSAREGAVLSPSAIYKFFPETATTSSGAGGVY